MEHHVYFWLNDGFKDEAARREFEEGMEALLGIGTIGGGMWGRPAATPERPVTEKSWDYALSLKFGTVADHDAYQDAPAHHEFVERFKERWAKVMVMDVE